MSEQGERLLQAMTEISDRHIDETLDAAAKKKRPWKRWVALAACLALVVGIGTQVVPRMGGNSGGAGGSGTDGGSTFMSYAGPVFPLTLGAADGDITAERELTLDFAPWVKSWWSNEDEANSRTDLTEEERQDVLADYSEWYPEGGRWQSSSDIFVTDRYTLTNGGDADKTVQVLYPFAGSISELAERTPAITVDGESAETTLRVGAYSGGFQGAWGEEFRETGENTGTVNLLYPESWEEYKTLLADGSYLEKALGELPDLSGVSAIVYRFTDPWGEPEDDDAGIPNPSIRVEFELDYDKTQVLTTGFHSGLFDRENGVMGKGFSIPQPDERAYAEEWCLIVVGEDISNITTQGYVTGGWDTKKTIESGVSMERYETDLATALRTLYLDERWAELDPQPGLTYEMYCGLCFDQLLTYGLLADDPMERYNDGMLMNEFAGIDRVLYLETEITVPAGGSVTLEAVMRKEGSYDFYCAHTENQGVCGYDAVTALGSNLTFTGQAATLVDRGQITVVRQNFGFDLAAGVSTVTLDPAVEHYYLEVKRAPEPAEE